MHLMEIRRDAVPHAPFASVRCVGADGSLDREWFRRRFAIAITRVEARADLALALKRVLLITLRQEPHDTDEHVLPIRTVRGMCMLAGYSPPYISKLAAAAGIRLGQLIDLTLALRMLQLVASHRSTLSDAATRMGLADASAVPGFIARATGTRPSRLTRDEVARCFDRLCAMLDGDG